VAGGNASLSHLTSGQSGRRQQIYAVWEWGLGKNVQVKPMFFLHMAKNESRTPNPNQVENM